MKKLKIISLGALILLGWGTTFVFANSDFPTGETCTRTRGRTETRSKCDSNGRKHTTYTPIKENREKRRFVHATHCSNLGTCNVYGIGSSINSMTIAYRGTRRFNCRTANVRKPTTKRTSEGCAVNGVCGGTNGQSTYSPSAGCIKGIYSNWTGLYAPSYTGRWKCNGINGGSTASCWTKKKINGVCGGTNGQSTYNPNVGCRVGISFGWTGLSAPSYNGQWKCKGINGGSTVSCWTKKKIDGVCGGTNGQSTYNPSAGCSAGTNSGWTGISAPSYTGQWNCNGINSGSTASCSTKKKIDGVCSSSTHYCSNEGGSISYGNYSPSSQATPNNTSDPSNNIKNSQDGSRLCDGINSGINRQCDEHAWVTYNTGNWTTCGNLSNWNNNQATCTQTRIITPSYNKSYGNYNITTPADEQRPGYGRTTTISLNLDLDNSTCDDITAYADNVDTCNINMSVDDIPAEGIIGLHNQQATAFDYTDIFLNQATQSGLTGDITIPDSSIQGAGTVYNLNITNITSKIPFSLTNGTLLFNLNGDNMVFNDNVPIGFRKPFTGGLSVGPTGEIILETEQTTTLNVNKVSGIVGIGSYSVTRFDTTIKPTNDEYDIYLTGFIDGDNPEINTRIYLSTGGVSGESGLMTNPYMHYTIGTDDITYILTESDLPDDDSWITFGEGGLQGVKIVGLYQGEGKLYNSAQDENTSDITTIEYRNNIIKNAEILIRDINPGEIRGGVRYEEGDITINSSTDFSNIDTLIIKDGNLTIEGDIDTSKLLGLIVLGDYYTNPSIGNVFIDPAVDYINAAIFADGGFISVWSEQSDTIGYTDNPTRTSDLQEQLVMKGTLITRNTIGGALDAGDGDYILPGGSTTTDFDQAMMYDLNYIRRGDSDPVGNASDLYGAYPFIVLYDSRIQSTPPPGFGEE